MRKPWIIIVSLCLAICISLLVYASASEMKPACDMEQISAKDCVVLSCGEVSDVQSTPVTSDIPQTEIISEDSIVFIPEVAVISGTDISPYATMRLEFSDAPYGITYIGNEDVVVGANETTVLDVDTLVWAPEHYTLRVGFWNISTGVGYYHSLTGVDYEGTLYYSGLEAGTYRVYVKNMGSSSLTTGIMRYNIS